MLNTGLRAGELLGLLNRDVDVENRVMHIRQGVKEIERRDGITATLGREMKVGKLKSASSKRDIPLNSTVLAMIEDLPKGTVLRRRFAPRMRREGQPYASRESPKALLPHSGGGGNRAKRSPCAPTHLRHQLSQRHKARGRLHPKSLSQAGRRSPRTQHLADYRDVLRQERYEASARYHRWLRPVADAELML